MQTLDLILSKSRGLVRQEKLDVQTATQRAIDEVAEGSNQVLDELELQELAMQKLSGYGALQPFMDDGEIEEIWINRPNELHYFGAKGYRKVALDLPASELRSICYRLLSHSKRRVDRLTPFVDAAISDGSRLHIVIPEITQEHWAINIRKFPKANVTLADLHNLGTIDDLQHRRLKQAMVNGESVLIAGATQAGKTTLLSALLLSKSREFLATAPSAKRIGIVGVQARVSGAISELELCAEVQNPLNLGAISVCRIARAESFIVR